MQKTESLQKTVEKERKYILSYLKQRYWWIQNSNYLHKPNEKVTNISEELEKTKRVLETNNLYLNKLSF